MEFKPTLVVYPADECEALVSNRWSAELLFYQPCFHAFQGEQRWCQ